MSEKTTTLNLKNQKRQKIKSIIEKKVKPKNIAQEINDYKVIKDDELEA